MEEKINIKRELDEEYRKYYDRCVQFAKSYLCDIHEAQTVASDALLAYWDKTRNQGEEVRQPVPFLFGVVRNKSLDVIRARYAKKRQSLGVLPNELEEIKFRMESLEACDPHILYSADVQSIINDTLASLGGKTKEVFELSRYQGLSNAQISDVMGIGLKAVEYHISKSLKAFRVALKDYLPAIASLLSL